MIKKIKLRIILLISAVIIFGLLLICQNRRNIRIWNDINVLMISSDYFSYKKNGGRFKSEYYAAINMDKYRDELAKSMSVDDILRKFPDAKLGSSYGNGSYRKIADKNYGGSKIDGLVFIDGQDEEEWGLVHCHKKWFWV